MFDFYKIAPIARGPLLKVFFVFPPEELGFSRLPMAQFRAGLFSVNCQKQIYFFALAAEKIALVQSAIFSADKVISINIDIKKATPLKGAIPLKAVNIRGTQN